MRTLILGLVLLVGCDGGKDDSGPPTDGGSADGGTSDGGGADGGAIDSVKLYGRITQNLWTTAVVGGSVRWVPDSGEPVETTTDNLGKYTLEGLAPGVDGAVDVSADGVYRMLVCRPSPSADEAMNVDMLTSDEMVIPYDSVGSSLDPSLGTVGFQVVSPGDLTPLSGAVVHLEPDAGEGPYYLNEDTTVDESATSTKAAGFAEQLNVPPGTYQGWVTWVGGSCGLLFGGAEKPEFGVEADTLTVLMFACE